MKKQSLYSILIYGAAFSIVGKFIGAAFQFVSQIILGRYLGPDEYGAYSIGWSFFQILSIFSTFGLDYAVIKFGADYWNSQLSKLKNTILRMNALAVIIGALLLVLIYTGIDEILVLFHREELAVVFKLFAPGISLYAILKVNSAATRLTNSIKYTVITEEIIRRGTQLVLFLFIVALGLGLKESIIASNISFLVACVVALIIVFRLFFIKVPGITTADFRNIDVLKYSMVVAGSSIISSILVWSDRIFLGMFNSTYQAGIYNASSQITSIFSTIVFGTSTVVAPLIANNNSANDLESTKIIYKTSTKLMLYLGLPLALVIFVFPEQLIQQLYGVSYLEGVTLLLILTVTQLINLGTGAISQMMLMADFEHRWFRFSAISLIANIVLNVLLIPRYGGIGAAIGSGAAFSLLNILGLVSIKKNLNINPYDKSYLKVLGSILITFALLLAGNMLKISHSLFSLGMIIVGAYLIFAFCLILFGIEKQEKDFILNIVHRFSKPKR